MSRMLLVLVLGCGGDDASKIGDLGSGPSGSDATGNSPPSVPEIAITPTEPSGADNLVVDILTPSSDPDGDPVEYRVAWSVDGEVLDGLASLTLDTAFTHKGDVWTVEVSAFDGRLESESVTDSVSIENSLPTVDNIVVTPESPTVKDKVICEFDDPVDLDNDEVTVRQSWAINGELVDVEGELESPHFVKHDEVECLVYAEDGAADTVPFSSEPVTIANSLPNVIGCSLDDNEPSDDVDVGVVSEGFYDDDGDPEGYRFAWYLNDVMVSEEQQLPASLTSVGDNIFVECTAWDGEDIGNMVRSASGTVAD